MLARPRFRSFVIVALLLLGAAAAPTAADAAGTPNISLALSAPAQVPLGKPAAVSLTAGNPVGQPYGYNLSFRDLLPAGISYVAGSARFAGSPLEPQVIVANAGLATETTTLIWVNVGDLSPNANATLSYKVAHATSGINAYTVTGARSSYVHDASAYINTNPRTVPVFNSVGVQTTGSTGSDAKTATTTLTAVTIAVTESSPEGELLRGAHDHQTVYTLHLENNTVNPTGVLTVVAYLPAGLEFLRCGQTDNTTSAATNPGSTEEWPGSGPLSGNLAAPTPCDPPNDVATMTLDPDGAGSLPTALYTRVSWNGIASLTPTGAGNARDILFVAAVPLRANTATFTGATPTTAGLGQAANLDNNNGARTEDEQSLPTYATVAGNYNGVTPVSNSGRVDVTAEDIRIVKTASQATIADDQLTRWTLALATGEYRYVDDVRVTDIVPDGLCPLDTTNLESDATADCAPAGLGDEPSVPYQSATENTTGTWTLKWDSSTDSALTRIQPSATHEIEFSTRSRPNYQENGGNDKPVLARDVWTNSASLLGTDFQRCSDVPDCGLLGVKLDPTAGLPAEPDLDGTDDLDVSSASQSADGPVVHKTIRSAGGVVPTDCSGVVPYVNGPAGPYGPGDRVCFKLRVEFPAQLDTGGPTVTDFLPAGVTYEGPYVKTPNNTVVIASSSGVTGDPVVTWTLGSGTGNAANGQVFEVLIAGRVTDATAGKSADVKGNLMKLSHVNSAGQSFPLRDEADFTWAEPQLTLLEGIRDINNTPAAGNAANVDGGTVQAGDVVTVRVDVTNGGTRDAVNTTVWERLPSLNPAVACPPALSISDGGSCSGGVITWTGLSVLALATRTLTYDYTVPAGARPGTTFSHHAGVRKYESDDNAGGTFQFFPASNIDPTVIAPTVNAAVADDTTSVATGTPAVTYTATSDDVNQVGNATGAAFATIGERISYTATTTLPQGTTLQDSAGPATFTIPFGAKQTFIAGSATFLLNGLALPAGFTASATATGATVTFPSDYVNAAGSGADVLAVTYTATVGNAATNQRTSGQAITTTATLHYADGAGVAQTPNASHTHNIVEPNLALAKASNAVSGRVGPGQTVRYTLTVTNPSATRISGANDVVILDSLPSGLTPVGPTGIPIADGANVQPSAGVWDATARTIRYVQALAAVGSSTAYSYDVKVSDQDVGNVKRKNIATATATSYPGSAPGAERDAALATAQSLPGYNATANVTVQLIGPSLTKTVDGSTATVGGERAFTLDVTIPAQLDVYDVTVRDLLSDGLDYEPGTFAATCVGGCGLSATDIAPTANGDGSTQLGFFIGDVSFAAVDRVVHITYLAHVDDRYEPEATPVVRGAVLLNTAVVHSNQADGITGTPTSVPGVGAFSDSSATVPATVSVTVVEPALTIDKDVSGQSLDTDLRNAQPGDTFTYTLTVSNAAPGNATAYDVVVTDRPDAELVGVSSGALPSGVTLTKAWAAGDHAIAWTIDSIAAGASVTFTYTAALGSSAILHEADQAINTADIPAYFGRPLAERTANGFDYRPYGTSVYDVVADVVTVSVDLPRIEVDLTTGGAGFPESAGAEVGQPFGWRAIVRNTSPSAAARNADLTVRLPRNWTYTAGSQVGGGGEPTITPDATLGDLLTWSNFVNLAAGATQPVTFDARPTLAAETDPGTGAAQIARANVTADDFTGASGSADGPYADGPDPAQGVLLAPALAIIKTPDNGNATAGTTGTWTVKVDNNGTGTARTVRVTDTIPAGVSYTAGSATSASPGFSESSNTLNGDGTRTVVWTLSNLAPSGTAGIAVPVAVPAGDDAGTIHTNSATVRADEQPAGPTDTGSLIVITRADLGVAKSASPTSQNAGGTVDFTMLVTNHGPSEARSSTLTDTLPAGLTFVSFVQGAPDCSETAGAITCAFGTLAPAATRTVQVQARIGAAQTGTLTNTATVGTATTDPVAANNTNSAQVTLTEQADLKVTKSTVASPILQGETAGFTIIVENLGPSDARNVSVADTLPSGMTLISMSPSAGTCAVASATCSLGIIAANATATVTVVARADTPGTKTNLAAATTSASDPTVANNSDDAQVTVDPAVDLEIVKSAAPTVRAGSNFDYTLLVTDHGPSGATGVTVTDTLPAGLTFVSATPDQGTCGYDLPTQTLSCPLGPIAKDAQARLTVTVTPAFSLADSSLTNTASVAGDQTDPTPANNADDATVNVGPVADLAVSKGVAPATVAQNRNAGYTLIVVNHGVSSATAAALTDVLPTGITFVSLTQDSGPAGSCSTPAVGANGTVGCTWATLAEDAPAHFTLVVKAIDTGAPVNTATVTGADPDSDPANNAASATLTVTPTADLAITKTGPATAIAGGSAAYALTATNSGPSSAHDVVVTDTLPTGLTFVSATTPGQGACTETSGTLTCLLGTIAPGDAVAIALVTHVAFAAAGQTLTNVAAVDADEADNGASDDTDSIATLVGPATDLRLEKTAAPAVVAQNQQATYTLKVTNDGPSDATGVSISDPLPAGVVFVAASAGCTVASGTVTCAVGAIADGASATVTVTVRAVLNGVHANVATTSGNETESDPSDNTAGADLSVGPTADLSVTKTAPATMLAGATVTYTITAHNAGPSAATGVIVSDTLPAGMEYVSSDPSQGSCTEASGHLTCPLGGLADGASATITLAARASFALAGQTAINNVSVAAGENDNDPSDDSATHRVTVGPAADLQLTKSAPTSVPVGGRLLYVLRITNAGPQDATGAIVTDELPDGLTFVSAEASQGTCAAVGRMVSCELGGIPVGGGAQVLIAADVGGDRLGEHLRNVGAVAGDQPDPDPGDNADDAVTEISARAVAGGISVTKVANGARVVRLGTPISFTITVRNDSTVAATGVATVDTPAAAVDVSSVRPSQGHCSGLHCELGTIAAGGRATVEVVMAPLRLGTLLNSVTVVSDQSDADASDNLGEAIVGVRTARTWFRLSKRTVRHTVRAGDRVAYFIRATNLGPRPAANVRVCDTPGTGLTFVRARRATFSHGRACWTVAYWKAGATRTFRVLAQINGNRSGRVRNTAVLQAANARTLRRVALVRVTGTRLHGGGVTG